MVIVGVDEVGRGCWAGPLVAGAVMLRQPMVGLKDSKLLSKQQREKLTAQIELEAAAIGLGWVEATELDRVGLTAAVRLAMERALAQIELDYDEIIIDGNLNFLKYDERARAVVKADSSVPAVSAASIIAKVARDRFMAEQAVNYPQYGFDRHVGYGTALHLARLKQYGLCQLHRRSFKPVRAVLELSL